MPHALQILAGPAAAALLRERGLHANDVDVVVGASGGPKWLVLAGLDRAIFGEFLAVPRERPLHLIGSSVGSWRMACLAQQDAVAAIARFEEAYIAQCYSPHPSAAEVSRMGEKILEELLGERGAREILEHPCARLHVITARSRGLVRSERKAVQMAGLALAAIGNAISRRSLRHQFERVIFETSGERGPFRNLVDLPTRHVPLTHANLRPALMASGSIPLVLEGVKIPGAPRGVYRDGGVIDYHPDFDFGSDNGLVLYPHFYPHVVPGWFDKSLSWRKAGARNFDRVLMLAPAPEFVAGLPGGRIPDRKDFYRYDDAQRMRIWQDVCDAGKRLGDEFRELVVSGRWEERIQPVAG